MSTANDIDLATRIRDFASSRVLVVGDVMLDRFIIGSVNRISPEAPVPVLKVEHAYSMLGGAGNVIRNVAALGAIPSFVGVVGNDSEGEEVRALMAEVAGLVRNHLLIEAGRPTTRKIRYLANNHQLLRVDSEVAAPLTAGTVGDLIRAAEEALNSVDVLVLSDYAKGVLSPATVANVIRAALRANCRVIVDPKTRDFSVYRGASLITPNRDELASATGLSARGDAEIEQACKQVIATCDIEAVLATRSEEGMTLVTREGRVHHLAANAREVFDVSGAGDTVAAVLGAALAAGADLVEAGHLANLAAGIVVGKIGTAVVRPDELIRTVHEEHWVKAESKIVSLEIVLEQVGAWRRAGLRIGFTNGCFDLLHPGHVSLLRQARAACDRLVIGLNNDTSVKRLKGDGRPVQPESTRAVVLASLADVDRVVIFVEDTPLKLIDAIRPDVLVKGADYSRDTVVGGDIIERYGGRVLLADLVPGHSTTATIKRLNAGAG
jgi:D-beta-D-heptose 7-phosphate kinase/D-beta-D-heptose 1-phosphate adenosyltransferase